MKKENQGQEDAAMNTIKFSHRNYRKLGGVDTTHPVMLLEVFMKHRNKLSREFIYYDTQRYNGDPYILPDSMLIVLVFQGEQGSVFMTCRRHTPGKHAYYLHQRGKLFKIEVNEKQEGGV